MASTDNADATPSDHTNIVSEHHPDDPAPDSTEHQDKGETPPPPAVSAPSAEAPVSPPPTVISEHHDEAPALPPREPEQGIQEEAASPQVAALQAIFPDFDAVILQSVLESVGWDQDRAVDALLGMSDPDYVPQQEPAAPIESQTDLDEQLARRLMLEEEQQHQQAWNPQDQRSVPYQPRVRHSQQPQLQQDGQAGGRDTMAEFQDQVSKFAESGKRTFSSIVSKVKTKMQEMDQGRPGPGSSNANTTPNWGGAGGSSAPADRHATQAYYAPTYHEPESRMPAQGYDMAPSPPAQSTVQDYAFNSPQGPPPTNSTGVETPRPPQTQTGPPTPSIDPTKIGLLPKRPVSLYRDQTPSQPAERRPRDDDDELEYVENPFEERK